MTGLRGSHGTLGSSSDHTYMKRGIQNVVPRVARLFTAPISIPIMQATQISARDDDSGDPCGTATIDRVGFRVCVLLLASSAHHPSSLSLLYHHHRQCKHQLKT